MLDYHPGHSIIHKLDVRTKTIILSMLMILLFLFKSPLFNLSLSTFSTLLVIYIHMPYERLWRLLKPTIPILILVVILAGFTYSASSFESSSAKQILFYAWSNHKLPFSYGGFCWGLTLLFRIYSMILLTSVFTFTTPIHDFIQLMHLLRLPGPLTFLVVTAIRFIPTMQKKVEQVFDAQRARGARLAGKGMFGQIVAYLPIMVPLIVDSIRMSEKLAISMLNRGYGATTNWTVFHQLHMRMIDYLTLFVFLIGFACCLYFKIIGYGSL
ncbi:energy-coupling factor transporter transmembrane protein EcfT [Paenibacillus albiflavus]|uniref:Energy-coupling factor transporter transmembrane protein EcfT n=1 Tax=Paenibacillus albiflavus TaxID=2545760 RepID=A0A4V2WNG7_9BACL|nr:energy-coupling factor transporter transmembrane component T [Paenibacillus albiflavus]TCZ75412.1 energy-coupling factor transporter transmembrane protein EcfT [Paenibacillus albiflavus]